MFPLLIPMAVGAAGGALLKKKDPLKGALLGAGLGAGAAAAAPAIGGLLGGSGAASTAAAAAPWADAAGAVVAPAAGSGSGVIGGLAPQTGLLASANSALTQYKPMIDAATTGIQMSGALDQQPEQPLPTAHPMMNQGGAEVLAGLASQGGAQQDIQERARRRAMLRGGV